jgi:hypothetical protein
VIDDPFGRDAGGGDVFNCDGGGGLGLEVVVEAGAGELTAAVRSRRLVHIADFGHGSPDVAGEMRSSVAGPAQLFSLSQTRRVWVPTVGSPSPSGSDWRPGQHDPVSQGITPADRLR